MRSEDDLIGERLCALQWSINSPSRGSALLNQAYPYAWPKASSIKTTFGMRRYFSLISAKVGILKECYHEEFASSAKRSQFSWRTKAMRLVAAWPVALEVWGVCGDRQQRASNIHESFCVLNFITNQVGHVTLLDSDTYICNVQYAGSEETFNETVRLIVMSKFLMSWLRYHILYDIANY